jgi:protein-arginine kinase activator protein McsA
MSWDRVQHRKVQKPRRHARVPLGMARCEECGRTLHTTHSLAQLGSVCRECWLVFSAVVVEAVELQAMNGVRPS